MGFGLDAKYVLKGLEGYMLNKATIENKDYISDIDREANYLRKITFPKRIYEGDRWIEFTEPFSLECYYIEVTDERRTAYYSFNFGMDSRTPLKAEHNCILTGHEDLSDEEKIVLDVTFDLFHAFFHVSDDPNYNYYHWALYGNLKDIVKYGDSDE